MFNSMKIGLSNLGPNGLEINLLTNQSKVHHICVHLGQKTPHFYKVTDPSIYGVKFAPFSLSVIVMVPQGSETGALIKKYSQMFKKFFQTSFLFWFERHAHMHMCVQRKRNFYINVVGKFSSGSDMKHERPADIFSKKQQML